MEWLTENGKQAVGGLSHALKAAERDVPEKARVPYVSLLTALLAVLEAIDAFLAALRSKDAPKKEVVGLPIEDDEPDTPSRDTPPRR